mgnify:CR=1 FL=1
MTSIGGLNNFRTAASLQLVAPMVQLLGLCLPIRLLIAQTIRRVLPRTVLRWNRALVYW